MYVGIYEEGIYPNPDGSLRDGAQVTAGTPVSLLTSTEGQWPESEINTPDTLDDGQ